jgi:hypothetical protein
LKHWEINFDWIVAILKFVFLYWMKT